MESKNPGQGSDQENVGATPTGTESEINREIGVYNRRAAASRWTISFALVTGLALIFILFYESPLEVRDLSLKLNLAPEMVVDKSGSNVFVFFSDSLDPDKKQILLSRDSARHFTVLNSVFDLPGDIVYASLSPDEKALIIGSNSRLCFMNVDITRTGETESSYCIDSLPRDWKVCYNTNESSMLVYGNSGMIKKVNYATSKGETIQLPGSLQFASLAIDPETSVIKGMTAASIMGHPQVLLEGNSLDDLVKQQQQTFGDLFNNHPASAK